VKKKKTVLQWFSHLVAAMNEDFLIHASIHRPIIKLLRASIQPTGTSLALPDVELEVDLVEMIYHICRQIKSFPDLLIIFFRPRVQSGSSIDKNDRVTSPTPTTSSTNSQHSDSYTDFLLFSFCLCFVHREGRTGDLTKAALLFLIEVAFTVTIPSSADISKQPSDANIKSLGTPQKSTVVRTTTPSTKDASLLCAEWMLDSDFAEVVGAGVGATYGLLPSRLFLSLSDLSHYEEPPDIQARPNSTLLYAIDAHQPEVVSSLSLFLRLFQFAEDIIQIATSVSQGSREKELLAGMLQETFSSNIKSLFLDSVLYPSMVESAERDGSALAILFYLERLVSSRSSTTFLLEDVFRDLITEEPFSKRQPGNSSHLQTEMKHENKSIAMLLISKTQNEHSYFSSLGRFSLRDLITQCLQSRSLTLANQTALYAALRLLSSLHSKLGSISLALLGESVDDNNVLYSVMDTAADAIDEIDEDRFIYPAERRSQKSFVSMATVLDRQIEDLKQLKSYASFPPFFPNGDDTYLIYLENAFEQIAFDTRFRESMNSDKEIQITTLSESRMLELLLRNLSNMFHYSPQTNLALTQILSQLACCPLRRVDDWLSPLHSTCDSETFSTGKRDSVKNVLKELQKQVAHFFATIPDFEMHYRDRKQNFSMTDDLADALKEGHTLRGPSDQQSGGNRRERDDLLNPFADHYLTTSRIYIQLQTATASRSEICHLQSDSAEQPATENVSVTLSSILNNTILLGEFVKEIAAIVQVRRACGIDSIEAYQYT